jgi:tetratricopeptide (TPR) repeat protein
MSDLKSAKRQMEKLLQAGQLREACELGEKMCETYSQDADVWYLKGMAEAQSNAFDAAAQSFGRVLALAPDDAVTHYNLARIHRAQGRVDEAIASYREALRVQPNLPEAHNNLADLLREHMQIEEAETHYREALRQKPGFPEAWYGLGLVLEVRHDLAGARQAYEQALQRRPRFAEAHNNLGTVLKRLGDLAGAQAACLQAIECKPDFAEAWNNLGELRREQGEFAQAERHFRRAMEINPALVLAYVNMANTQRRLEDYAAAHATLERALKIAADDPLVHMACGNLAKDTGAYEDALNRFDRVLALRPQYAHAHFNRAVTLQWLGRMEEARAAFREALKYKPDYGEAYRLLEWGRSLDESVDDDIAAMEQLWNSPETGEEDRMHLAFALGKVAEGEGDYDAAFRFFSAGNQARRARIHYDIEHDVAEFERLMAVFSAEFFAARDGWGSTDATPIVIVGMPRSGTSLVEQILASHPRVAGGGELHDLLRTVRETLPSLRSNNFPEGALGLDRDAFTKLGEAYVARLRARCGDEAEHVTDKMPANFALVGMLRVILPRARVIHCRRDPLDTCWSIYKQFFGEGQHFSYGLEELGRYYRLYQRLMAHWAKVLPGYMLEFDYETLVNDQEDATRRLLEFCGLEWDKRCLEFHRTDRAVKTASVTQVRRPMYASSVGIAKRYGDRLTPLIKALEKT